MQLLTIHKTTPVNEGVITKTGRILKITAIILLTACLQVSARGYSQAKVTLHVKDAPLLQVLNEIREQTGYNFFAQTEWLKKAHPVDLEVKEVPLKEALDICFKDQP